MGSLNTVGGDLTIETTGSGTFDVSGADVEGDTSLTTDGYTEVDAATAGGETAVTMLNSEATMEVTLPDGAFSVGRSGHVQHREAARRRRGDRRRRDDHPPGNLCLRFCDPDAQLGRDAEFRDRPGGDGGAGAPVAAGPRACRRGADAGRPRRCAGRELQLFDVCAGGGPVADACIIVQWLDENRMLLDPLGGIDPSLLRFESLVGHFSTYSVVAVTLAGDYNLDGIVDAADYILWRKTDGTQEGYDRWRANFGRSAGGGNGAGMVRAPEFRCPSHSVMR